MAYSFTTTSRINVGSTNFPADYPITMMCVCQPNRFSTAAPRTLMSISSTGVTTQFVQLAMHSSGGGLKGRFVVRHSASYNSADGTTDISGSSVAVLVGVATGSTDRVVFVNGVMDVSNTTDRTFPVGLNRANIGMLARTGTTDDPASGGVIISAAIWNTALSTREISFVSNWKNLNAPLYVARSNLVGFWRLDEGVNNTVYTAAGVTLRDYSGNGNHGDPVNTVKCQPFNVPVDFGIYEAAMIQATAASTGSVTVGYAVMTPSVRHWGGVEAGRV